MVTKRMKATAALKLVRVAARKEGLSVERLRGRGKGSHAVYVVMNADGQQVGRFGITGHGGKDVSITVLCNMEDALAHLFGKQWMETQ